MLQANISKSAHSRIVSPARSSCPAARSIVRMAANQAANATAATTVHKLQAVPITPENFKPFGQVIGITADGQQYDHTDAKLKLDEGTPRFYIMRLPRRSLKFHKITFHAKCTQCLGLLAPMSHWYMVVAKPSGSVSAYPKEADLQAFRIPHGVYIKLEQATWHAGPLYEEEHDHMDFYNLELSDTNVVDHNTHDYHKVGNMEFVVEDPEPPAQQH